MGLMRSDSYRPGEQVNSAAECRGEHDATSPSAVDIRGRQCFAALPATAQSPFAPKVSGPLSQRVVAYQIDAKYDPAKHTVDATETLTYHNLTGQPLDRFPFHLYLNAFQPKSTWVREAHRDGNFRSSSLEEWEPEGQRVE